MAPERGPARHDLAWLRPSWRDGLREPVDLALLPALEDWFARGLPAVVRRLGPPRDDSVGLGVALPSRLGGARAALRVAPGAVARLGPPLRLGEVVASAPARWRAALLDLDAEAGRAGLSLGVYGSLLWQHLSGEPRVTARSDVDLLVRPGDRAGLRRALATLGARAAEADPRLDGEAILGGGRAVAWRELLAPRGRVLVKSGDGATLVPLGEALGYLGAEPAA